jgi:hypothetical protein
MRHRFAVLLLLLAPCALPQSSGWRVLPLIAGNQIHPAWRHTGWGAFAFDQGALRTECDERGMGALVYTAAKFGGSQIRIVYRSEKPASNAGVFIRIDDGVLKHIGEKSPEVRRNPDGRLSPEMIEKLKVASEKHLGGWYPVHHGFEVQINDAGDAWHRTGALYSLAEAATLPEKPASEWRTMIITLDGEKVAVEVDGKPVSRFDASASNIPPRKAWSEPIREIKRPTHGYIALQNHDPGDVVWFKEVAVRPLSSR